MLDKMYNICYHVRVKESKIKKVTVRNLQHNLAMYLELAKTTPLVVTKHRKDTILMVNPVSYYYAKKTSKIYKAKGSKFIGMHKDRKDWQGLSNNEVVDRLRSDAWYGK